MATHRIRTKIDDCMTMGEDICVSFSSHQPVPNNEPLDLLH